MKNVLSLVGISLFVLAGCGGEPEGATSSSGAPKTGSSKPATSAAPAASSAAPAASTSAAPAAPAADAGAWVKTGNAACDAAADKFAACLEKDPELKKQFNTEVAEKLKAIKTGLEDPATKGMQEQTCTMYFELKQAKCK